MNNKQRSLLLALLLAARRPCSRSRSRLRRRRQLPPAASAPAAPVQWSSLSPDQQKLLSDALAISGTLCRLSGSRRSRAAASVGSG